MILVLVALIAFVLGGGIDFLCWREPAAYRRLHGKLARVGVQFDCWGLVVPPTSDWHGRWLWTDDPSFLARVEAWLPTLYRPLCENALRQRGNRLVLVFEDGRQEEMLFLGPDRPGPSEERCGGFIWDGHGMSYEEEPFSELLWGWSPTPAQGPGDSSR
jgi:hypothetical protein